MSASRSLATIDLLRKRGQDAIGELAGGLGIRLGIDEAQVRGRFAGQFERAGWRRGCGAMLAGQDELLLATTQEQVAVAPGVQVAGAAQGLAVDRAALLAQMMDQHQRQLITAAIYAGDLPKAEREVLGARAMALMIGAVNPGVGRLHSRG